MSKLDELDLVIRRQNGKVIAGIPQLGLFARADDINAAIAALDAKKTAFVADLKEAGELDMLELEIRSVPKHDVATIRPAGNLGQFALKTVIVVCCLVGALAISGVLIASKVERSVENTVAQIKSVKIGGSQFWTKLEGELDRMAQPGSDLPEAKKQKLLTDIRVIAAKWRPFVVEIQTALSDQNRTPRPAGAPADK